MDNLLHIRLRAVNSELKYDREYIVSLGRDLFQQWYIVITFGRYGSWGTSRTTIFEEQDAAYGFINSVLRRRLTSPKRIGCAYQLVSFNGAEEIVKTMNHRVIERFSWFRKEEMS